eukprot:g3104.t1
MYQALLHTIKNSLNATKKRVASRLSAGPIAAGSPLFNVNVHLGVPDVVLSPNMDDIQRTVDEAAKCVLGCAKGLWGWGQQGLPGADKINFFGRVAQGIEIVRVCLLLAGSIQGTRNHVAEYVDKFREYRWLWLDDRNAKYAEPMDTKPKLTDYESELMEFVYVERDTNALPADHSVGALSLNTEQLKDDLSADEQIEDMTGDIDGMALRCKKMPAVLREWGAYKELKKAIEDFQTVRSRVNLGLEKLVKGAEDVEMMKVVLADEQVKLDKATAETNKMLEGLEASSAEAKAEGEAVAKIAALCEEDAARIAGEKAACQKDLAKAQPYVDEAETAIDSVKPAYIGEINKLAKPSHIIKLVFDGVLILFKNQLLPVVETTLFVDDQLRGFAGGSSHNGYGYLVPFCRGPDGAMETSTGEAYAGKLVRFDLLNFTAAAVTVLGLAQEQPWRKMLKDGLTNIYFGYQLTDKVCEWETVLENKGRRVQTLTGVNKTLIQKFSSAKAKEKRGTQLVASGKKEKKKAKPAVVEPTSKKPTGSVKDLPHFTTNPRSGTNAAEQPKMLEHFEGLLEEWCTGIESCLSGGDADPANTKGLVDELDSRRTRETKAVIGTLSTLTKNTGDPNRQRLFNSLRRWKSTDITLTEAANGAKDNAKYLSTLERFVEPLYKGTPTMIVDTIPAMMNSIKMIHTIARYYSNTERVANLFVRITNQMIANCKTCILGECDSGKELWEQDPEDLVRNLETCLKLNEAYQEQFQVAKGRLAADPKGKQFDFDEQKIFGRFDQFCRRIAKLIDTFSTIYQFSALPEHKLEGMEPLIARFDGIVKAFQRKRHDMLDYTRTAFDRY